LVTMLKLESERQESGSALARPHAALVAAELVPRGACLC